MGPERVQPRPTIGQSSRIKPLDTRNDSFARVLEAQQQKVGAASDLTMSAHAAMRLREAGRNLSTAQMTAVKSALEKAALKGSRESLMLIDDLALVVSVPNRTVITVVTGERRKENVFTNIDSAIILNGPDLSEGAQGVLYKNDPVARQGGHAK